MTHGDTSESALSALRSVAHPVRLRILSLLTAEAMSAAEVARTLDLTHANASYHLRVLFDAGELVVESKEKIRGGVAKRYRYVVGGNLAAPPGPHSVEDLIAWAAATHVETVRRITHRAKGPASDGDIETWVTPETWLRAVELLQSAILLLHAEARPRGAEGAIPVSATTLAFQMEADA